MTKRTRTARTAKGPSARADRRPSEHRFALFTEAPVAGDDWIQIFPIGSYRYSDYGEVKITPERAERFAANFRDNVRGHAIPVNREHEQALGAIGWYGDVEARDDGVYARIDWTDEGKDALAAKRFRFFSPEFYDEWIDPKSGTTHEDLLVGGALTNYPRFYDMKPIAASEPVREAMKAAADSYEDRRAEVTEALQERFGYDAYTVETFDDHVVIEWQGEFWSVPYTVAPDGDVTLGMPEEVERVFQPPNEMSEWDAAYVNDLPDSAFAYIEAGGKKDDAGRTTPRSLRHFPIRGSGGKYDAAHVRNALARAAQSDFGDAALPKIKAAAKSLGIGEAGKKSSLDGSVEAGVVHDGHERTREGRMNEEATKTAETKPAAEPKTGADSEHVSMAEFRAAQDDAKKAREDARRANDRLRLMAANDVIDGAKRTGRLVPAEEEFWRGELTTASEEQFAARSKYLAEKPAVIEFGERGTAEPVTADDDDGNGRRGLHERTLKYASEHAADNGGKGISYKEALVTVMGAAKKGS